MLGIVKWIDAIVAIVAVLVATAVVAGNSSQLMTAIETAATVVAPVAATVQLVEAADAFVVAVVVASVDLLASSNGNYELYFCQ